MIGVSQCRVQAVFFCAIRLLDLEVRLVIRFFAKEWRIRNWELGRRAEVGECLRGVLVCACFLGQRFLGLRSDCC